MARVEYLMSEARLSSPEGVTHVQVWTTIDEADFLPPEVPGDPPFLNPDPHAALGPEIVTEITGPGWVRAEVWRGESHTEGQPPWRTTDEAHPNGLREAGSPVSFATGGPVKFLDSIHLSVSTAGR